MKKKLLCGLLFINLCLLLLSGCNAIDNQKQNNETLYQVSTIQSLLKGNYDGIETFSDLKKYGDFGLGTFNALNGEMILIDGHVYQIKSSGEVIEVPDTETTPFSAVTFFKSDQSSELKTIKTIEALETKIDTLITNKNMFYAIRVDGTFSYIKARSVPEQNKPYPLLATVVEEQSIFEYTDIEGTLVGFWSPDYVGGINVPGYHLHFISNDRSKGGHLLDLSFDDATINLDETDHFMMTLSPESNISELSNLSDDLNAVEK